MALSMDEQRVLAEIERRLSADDPGLATCLTTFRRPGPATVLRSPRARIIGSLFTVLLVAMVSLMVYAMIPFRAHGARTPQPTTATNTVSISAPHTNARVPGTQQASAGARASASGVRATATASTTTRATASDKALASKGKPTIRPAVSPAVP
jgi:cytoskeletal protein RodZ